MTSEREKRTPELTVATGTETAGRLREWLAGHGIKAVLFDFDDTLLDTNTFINRHKDAYVTYVTDRNPAIEAEALHHRFDDADMRVFSTHSVSKGRWDGAIELLIGAYPDADPVIFRDGAPHLHAMYVDAPELMPGAMETVRAFRAAADKIGLVTHADGGWTGLKLKRVGLDRMFDHVEVVDQFRNKEARDWAQAIGVLGIKPAEALIVGDSVKGDIRAAHDAGVKYLVALPSPWEVYRAGDMPEGTIVSPDIGSVIPTLLAL